MRVCVAFAVVLFGAFPALGAESAARRPAIPSPVQTYASMPPAERMAIQSDLLWAGHYEGMADGDFTERSIAAIRNFQNANKTKQTGVLNPQEREALAAAAKKEREAVGWRVVEDEPSGSRVGFPSKLLPQWVKNKLGSRWSSARGEAVVETFRIAEPGATIADVFKKQKDEPERKVESSQLKADSFVMSGLQGLKKFSARAEYRDGEVRGLTVLYDQAMEGTMAKIADAVWRTFVPFSRSDTAAVKSAEAKGKVDYGTGLVVSSAGHILTPRHMTEGCTVIVVQGLGNAETVAQDQDKGLALLRVYGNRRLAPLHIPAGAASGSEVTLIGIADPNAQAGGNAASSVRAKFAAANEDNGLRPMDSTPAPGFSGAIAVDDSNHLVGMLQFKPQILAQAGPAKLPPAAMIIPAESIRDFVSSHGVQLVSGDSGDTKASLVRVICVRK